MKMKKTVAILLTLLTVVFAASVLFATQSTAESLYIHKVVSVVYDDSGSMGGAKETYANYAMQTFCGMLNAEDKLYITYMSNPGTAKELKVGSAAQVEASLSDIRAHGAGARETPYRAVTTAYNKLMDKAGADTNPNTQYWLLIITDGTYTDDTSKNNLSNLNAQLLNYTDGVAPNGTNPKITYMTIGDAKTPTAVADRIYTYHADSAQGITSEMSKMADRISGRTRLERSDVTVSGKTATFKTNIPLLNVAVLSQNTDARITKMTVNDEQTFAPNRSHSVHYTGYYGTTAYSLSGGTALVGDTSKIMPAGEYVVTFDKNVNAKDLDFLLEPALETRMTVKLNGKQVSDVTALRDAMEGDTIDVSYKIFEIGTDKEVSPSLLPGGTTYGVTVKENGAVVKESDGMSLEGYKLKKTPTELTVSVKIPGVNAITYSTKFTPKEYLPTYTVTGAFEDPAKTEIKIKDIASNSDVRMLFTVYADGVALKDKSAVQALAPSLSTSVAGNEGKVEYLDNGQIAFTPNKASAPSGTLSSSYTVSVTCSAMGGSATLDYTVKVVEYTLDGSLEGGSEVFYKGIEQNDTFKLVFTLYADGKAVSDKKTVTDLAPTLTCTPDGNSGSFEVDGQGRIVFTPNRANDEAKDKDQTVTVTCTVAGVSKELTYTVKATVYTMQMEYENGQQSVKLDEIGSNDKTKLLFTFFANGVQLTNEELTALAPQISCEPAGNGGKSEIKDGVLIFTPNAASAPAGASDSYTVKVNCSIGQTTFEPVEYTVLIADYDVVAVESDGSVVKTKFFGNTEGVSFYITKDGEPLSKADLDGLLLSASGGKKYKNLKFDVKIEDVGDKGVITCTPYDEKEHKLTFIGWFVNYIYYWTLPGSDMNVQLSTPYGTGENELEVDPESVSYQALNVWTPLILELIVLAIILWMLYAYFAKPRFYKGTALYVGTVRYNPDNCTHLVGNISKVSLARKYNKFKYFFNPTLKSACHSADGIKISADHGGRIKCYESFPWFTGEATPYEGVGTSYMDVGLSISSVQSVMDYNDRVGELEVTEISTDNNVSGENNDRVITGTDDSLFFVVPDSFTEVNGKNVISNGTIFWYGSDV